MRLSHGLGTVGCRYLMENKATLFWSIHSGPQRVCGSFDGRLSDQTTTTSSPASYIRPPYFHPPSPTDSKFSNTEILRLSHFIFSCINKELHDIRHVRPHVRFFFHDLSPRPSGPAYHHDQRKPNLQQINHHKSPAIDTSYFLKAHESAPGYQDS